VEIAVTPCLSLMLGYFVKLMPQSERQSSRTDSNPMVQITWNVIEIEKKKKNGSDEPCSEHLSRDRSRSFGLKSVKQKPTCLTQRRLCYFVLDQSKNRLAQRTNDKYGKTLKLIEALFARNISRNTIFNKRDTSILIIKIYF